MLKAAIALALAQAGGTTLPWEINQLREQNDLPQLVSTLELDCAAYRHATDLHVSSSCGHVGSDGSTLGTRARTCGTSASFELLACGFDDPKDVMAYWMESEEVKNLLLRDDHLAVGSAQAGDVWVLVFRSRI